MTTIIITETFSPQGHYWAFRVKGDRRIIAEVDKRRTDKTGYVFVIFDCFKAVPTQFGSRTRKESAFTLARLMVSKVIPDAVFKHNVMKEHIKIA
jgi:hypothetical protein